MTDAALSQSMSPEVSEALQARLTLQWVSLCRRFTRGESTSLPAETAQQLLHSLLYTLGLTGRAQPISPAALISADLESVWAANVTVLQRQARSCSLLCRAAQDTRPVVPNAALTDTLHSLAGFARRYDPCFAAHELPADVDYQLALPVAETLEGSDYARAWLTHLLAENALLRRLDAERLHRMIAALGDPDGTQLMGLYLPAAANVTALTLLGRNPFDLLLYPEDIPLLRQRLAPYSPNERESLLLRAAETAAERLRLSSDEACAYLIRAVRTLFPALHAALDSGSPAGMFAVENSGFPTC